MSQPLQQVAIRARRGRARALTHAGARAQRHPRQACVSRRRSACALVSLGLVLAACQTVVAPDITRLSEPDLVITRQEGPPDAQPGVCWGTHVTPAVLETRTEHKLARAPQFADDGRLQRPAAYTTRTRTRIVQERRETWFEVPCPSTMTAEFVASLQRALKVRRLYSGPINGQMDAPTRRAVRRYQKPQGLDSGILSLAAARQLGLVAVERPQG